MMKEHHLPKETFKKVFGDQSKIDAERFVQWKRVLVLAYC